MALDDKEVLSIQVVIPPSSVGVPVTPALIFTGNGNYVIFRPVVDTALLGSYIYVGTEKQLTESSGIPLNVGTVDEFAVKTTKGQRWYAFSTNAAARLVIIEKK